MLHAGGENAVAQSFLFHALAVEVAHLDLLGPGHHVEEFRNGQAAFLVVRFFLARPHDLGVDEKQRLLLLVFL